MLTLYIGSDNVIELTGARDAITDAYLNSATVTYALKTLAGVEVDSGSLTYVAASDGDYRGVIDADVALECGAVYSLEVTLVQGSTDDFRKMQAIAQHRGVT